MPIHHEPVYVPLAQNISKTIKKCPLSQSDMPTRIAEYSTYQANFYNSVLEDSPVSSYSYDIAKSSRGEAGNILTITPLAINSSSVTLRSYSFQLPSNVAKNCIALSETEVSVVVDLLLDINVVITLIIPIESFFTAELHPLRLDNFYSWCKYSMPYSFDQSKPLLLESVNELVSVVSTKDGGLLLLKRTCVEADFSVSPLTTVSYINSIKSRFLFSNRNNNNNENMYIDFDGESIAIESFIDIAKISVDVFVAVSVNKKLSLWSISNRQKIKEVNLNDFLPESLHGAVLSPLFPNSSLHFSNGYMSVALSLDVFYIYVFKLDGDSLDLISQLTSPSYNKLWNPIDYCMISKNNSCKLWISWIFGNTAFFQTCSLVQTKTGYSTEWANAIEYNRFNEFKTTEYLYNMNLLTTVDDVNQYSLKFIQSQYDLNVLKDSVKFMDLSSKEQGTIDGLKNQIYTIINHNSESISDLKNEWIKFASICQDIYDKANNKVFAVSFDSKHAYDSDPFLFTIKENSTYSIIKQASDFEVLYFNAGNNNTGTENLNMNLTYSEDIKTDELVKLIILIKEYSKGFDNVSTSKIARLILEFNEDAKDIGKLMTVIFDQYIINITNETVVSQLLNTLSNIESASELITYLTLLFTENFSSYKINSSCPLSEINSSILCESLLCNSLAAERIIFGLMLVFLTLDSSPAIENLFSNLTEIFKYIGLIKSVGSLNVDNLIFKFIKKYNDGIYIKNNTLNYILIDVLNQMCNKKFVYFIISELISDEKADVATSYINYLPRNSEISTILKGFVYLENDQIDESKRIFTENTQKITNYGEVSNELLQSISSIKDKCSLVLVDNETEYFFNLSIIFETKRHYVEALEFAIQASKCLVKNTSEGNAADLENEIFYKIFELSLRLHEYKLSFTSIKEMPHTNRIIPLRKFVYKLFQDNQVGLLVEFDYGEDFDRVDDLIFSLGEDSLKSISDFNDIKLALKYYRVCYALRLKDGDFRGAIESLYRFNTLVLEKLGDKVYADTNKVQILKNNYLVMLNLMKSLETDDSWVIRHSGPGKAGEVVRCDGLEVEYLKFIERSGTKRVTS